MLYFHGLDLKKNTTCKAVLVFFRPIFDVFFFYKNFWNKLSIFQQTTWSCNYTGFSWPIHKSQHSKAVDKKIHFKKCPPLNPTIILLLLLLSLLLLLLYMWISATWQFYHWILVSMLRMRRHLPPTASSSAQEYKWISKTIIHGEHLTNYRLCCGRGLGMGGYKFLW